jgi:hypothetical protein
MYTGKLMDAAYRTRYVILTIALSRLFVIKYAPMAALGLVALVAMATTPATPTMTGATTTSAHVVDLGSLHAVARIAAGWGATVLHKVAQGVDPSIAVIEAVKYYNIDFLYNTIKRANHRYAHTNMSETTEDDDTKPAADWIANALASVEPRVEY